VNDSLNIFESSTELVIDLLVCIYAKLKIARFIKTPPSQSQEGPITTAAYTKLERTWQNGWLLLRAEGADVVCCKLSSAAIAHPTCTHSGLPQHPSIPTSTQQCINVHRNNVILLNIATLRRLQRDCRISH